MKCGWVKSQITLYLYNELDDPERVEVEQHVEHCRECAAELERERRLHQALSARPRPAVEPNLLAACRLRLSESLEEEERRARPWSRLLPLFASFHLNLRPTLAALLLIAGFAGGWVLSSHRERLSESLPGVVRSSLAGVNLANISSISSIRPDPRGGLVIEFETTRRSTFHGSPEDPQIEQLLVFAAKNYANPGIQLDSIDVLKNRAADQDIREALIAAMHTDQNPGVRLKALEGLRGLGADEQVKQALLDVLLGDSNAGMRIEAINQLSRLPDRSTVPLLQRLAAGDPNGYVRSRSAATLRELHAPEIF
jgi:hypothetical protein